MTLVSGARGFEPMGFASAERHVVNRVLTGASDLRVELRVVGGRAARRYARKVGARWVVAHPQHFPERAYWGSDLIHALALESPPPRVRPFVLTIHDVAGAVYDDEEPLPPWAANAFSRAQRILTPSRFTADEIMKRFAVDADKLVVIGSGLGLAVSQATPHLTDEQRLELAIPGPYILRLGGYTRRKNLSLLLNAWPAIRRATGLCLVLAGAPIPARSDALRLAPDLDGVIVLDYVAAEVIASLLRSAAVLVSTSLYEGVGLPPLEAMSAGVPVVAVRTPVAEEMYGDAVVLVANDAAELATRVPELLSDARLRQALTVRGAARTASFDWSQTARAVTDAYRAVLFGSSMTAGRAQ